MRGWRDLTGKEVVVQTAGMRYEGKLIEMTDVSLILKGVTGYREVPMDKIVRVEERGAPSAIRAPSPLDKFR